MDGKGKDKGEPQIGRYDGALGLLAAIAPAIRPDVARIAFVRDNRLEDQPIMDDLRKKIEMWADNLIYNGVYGENRVSISDLENPPVLRVSEKVGVRVQLKEGGNHNVHGGVFHLWVDRKDRLLHIEFVGV